MTEPTLKQWKRRALHAEAEIALIQKIRSFDGVRELEQARKTAAMSVALKECHEAIEWALQYETT